MTHRTVLLLAASFLLASTAGHGLRAQSQGPPLDAVTRGSAPELTTTAHVPLPAQPSAYWIVPDLSASRTQAVGATADAGARFARGASLIAAGDHAAGLPLVSGAELTSGPLAGYRHYYIGLANMRLERPAEAQRAFDAARALKTHGYLAEALPLRLAETAVAQGRPKDAVKAIDDVIDDKLSAPQQALLALGAAAEAAGDAEKALDAYRRVYYDYPMSSEAAAAQEGIGRLETPSRVAPDRFRRELARAELLFNARRYAQARAGFAPLGRVAMGDERELVALRVAECDYFLGRHAAARDALKPFLENASREAEARFFHLTATRALGERDTYVALARRLAADHPDSSWTEETLNNLASHYIIANEDAEADRVFRELYRRFPKGRHAERAAWKVGWWSYKNGGLAEAAQFFEGAAAAYPRADTRPAWLYWAGRARDQLGDQATANARYRIVAADYLNSYYGRLAAKLLESRRQPAVQPTVKVATTPAPGIPTEGLIRRLIELELYDDAIREVQYARRAWGDSPALQATLGFIYHRKGDLRSGINAIKRAYPQYLAAGGENLPPEMLRVLYPVDYYPLIKRHAEARGLDVHLISALVAQESTFTADIRSPANAIGLMQVIPGTGSRYARKLGIRRFSAASLTQPETNVRIGTAYFKDLVDRFGGAHFALASYNAGEHRIARWIAERPGLRQDEFIDDIPFPETQNYVKKILGTAEDYRRLYGTGLLTPGGRNRTSPAAAAAPPPAAKKKATPARAKKKMPPRRRPRG